MALAGKVCLVTGASRGIGKGIAVQLGEAGATVYITGRSSSADAAVVGGSLKETESEITSRGGGRGIAVTCDHTIDDQVKQLFTKIRQDHGKLDILVNNAYSAVSLIVKEAQAGNKFWQHELEPGQMWDSVNSAGLRNNYICCAYAAQMMVELRQGLIVNISSGGGITYLFNVPYGVGKAAVDRMSADMAVELKGTGVSCVTLYPGAVLTEIIDHSVLKATTEEGRKLAKKFKGGETPEFSGKAIVGLATDPNLAAKSGKICLTAELAVEYGFKDIDGRQHPSWRQVNVLLAATGRTWLAAVIPDFIKIPGFMMTMGTSKF